MLSTGCKACGLVFLILPQVKTFFEIPRTVSSGIGEKISVYSVLIHNTDLYSRKIFTMVFPKKNLIVKKSTLPKAGNGLFAKAFIPKGTRVAEYKGKVVTWKEVVKMAESENGYIFHFSNSYCLDARTYKKSLARYINDAKGIVRIKGLSNNTEYVTEKKRCFIDAIKNIPAGAELFVAYGAEYWNAIRYNARIEQGRQKKAMKKVLNSKR